MAPNIFGPCYYCGGPATFGKPHHREHFTPKCQGGVSMSHNIVAACGPCNSTKGRRLFEAARTDLVLRRLGWPKFTRDQLAWLKANGFDLTPVENGKLYFEENQ